MPSRRLFLPTPLLRTQGLRRLQVGPIELELAAGGCLAITGPSGAGKSVLLRMLADLDPHEGEAWLEGRACSAMPAPAWRRQVSYVAADSGWWLPQVGAHFEAGTDFAALLPEAGIAAEAAGWPVARLSTGERQRLALLRALRPGVRVLLLDEPTSGLDADNVARIEALLQRRRALGTALLLVTHDAAQAARLATRHLTLRSGQLGPAA